MDPRESPPWFGAITVKSNFGRNRWPRGSRKIEFEGMVIFLRCWPIYWTQWDPIGPKMDPRGSPPWFGTITVKSNFGRNRWPRGSRINEFEGMVIFYGFDPFFGPNGTPLAKKWTLGGLHRDFTVKSNFGRNRWPRGSRIIEFLGHGNFLRFWPIHWTQWDPIGHKVDPKWSTPWFYREVEFWSKSMSAG